jgi:hypothetical protein
MMCKELKSMLRVDLAGIENERGHVLYSGLDTLSSGTFYFMGFNPAADGTNPLLSSPELHEEEWSAYTKQCWMHPNNSCISNPCPQAGKTKHQKNVQRIMTLIGIKPERTFATNFIFVESTDVQAMLNHPSFGAYIETCWKVHKKLLAEVEPQYIVCLGHADEERKSAFSLVREMAELDGGKQPVVSRSEQVVGRCPVFKSFVGSFDLGRDVKKLKNVKVVGVLHPSRWRCSEGLHEFIER